MTLQQIIANASATADAVLQEKTTSEIDRVRIVEMMGNARANMENLIAAKFNELEKAVDSSFAARDAALAALIEGPVGNKGINQGMDEREHPF